MRTSEEIGSAGWVRDRLQSLPSDERWVNTEACEELISWLYAVSRQRARKAGIGASDRTEIAQDAMPRIVMALKQSRSRIGQAQNPAALLERVTARAVSEGVYRFRMAGLGGVRPNGRNWGTQFPRMVCGDTADLIEAIPHSPDEPGREVEQAVERVVLWIVCHVGVELTPGAVDAVVYVLDRLVAGISRAALVRGGRVGIAEDPAMRHLGFEPDGARVFARWLLGRTDAGHELPSVLDAALSGESVSTSVLTDWRAAALRAGFAVENVDACLTALRTRLSRPGRRVA